MQADDNNLRTLLDRALPWLLVLGAGTFLRTWQLHGQLLADDEWHAVHKLVKSDFIGIFTSFGFSDHSIPLTAYFELLSRTTGLSEWSMHLPLLLAGILTLMLVPWLLRGTLRSAERLALGSLLALSPLLIYFSRTARPYALSALLAFIALLAFSRWWAKSGDRQGAVYVTSCAMAAWLHPVTLAFTLTPFAFFGVVALWEVFTRPKRKFRNLLRICLLGLATLAALFLLLAVPVYNDFSLLAAKSGVHSVSLASLWASLSLFIGSANTWVIAVWLLLAAAGFRTLQLRQPLLAWYLAVAALLACVVVASTSALLIKHPLVLVRYLLPVLFIMLVFVALGIAATLRALDGARLISVVAAGAAVYAYVVTGPLPAPYGQYPNQFMGHMVYQADYSAARNRYARHFTLEHADVPAFYQQLARMPAGSATLAVAPWYMEWHWNAWHLYQQVHRQRVIAGFVSGLCVEDTYGEYPPGQDGMQFDNVVHLSELAEQSAPVADYLVFETNAPFQPAQRARTDLDLDECEQRIRDRFGPPLVDDGTVLAWKLR
jgi:hypothetical protein